MLASTSTISGSGRGVQMMTARGGGGGGGASGVMIEALVRRIADMAQSSTQNLGGKCGRMLSSSLLAMGVQQSQHETVEQNHDDDDNRDCRGEEDDTLCIWRVDPTGQFWKCDASAVGRGTVEVEAELLSRVRRWKKNEANMKKQRIMAEEDGSSTTSSVAEEPTVSSADDDDDDDEMKQVMITNNDVRSYLSSLTEDEAVSVASDCLVNGIMNCKGAPSYNHHSEKRNGGNSSSLRDWMEYDLRRRMQCVVLRSSCSSKQSSMKSYEIVRRL